LEDMQMKVTFVLAAASALVCHGLMPASAGEFRTRPENWQCAFGYGPGPTWVYGETVQYKPEAMSTAQAHCRARSSRCVFLGCFRRV
jgi:hypothetical protein